MKPQIALGTLLAIVFSFAPATALDVRGEGQVDPTDSGAILRVDIGYITSDGTTSTLPAGSVRLPRPIRRVWQGANATDQGLAPLCDAGDGPFTGWWYTVTTYTRAGELIGEPEPVCVPLPDPTAPSIPPPPDVPEPPTIGQIWSAAAAQIPAAQVGVSPSVDGVTGLETWLWATSPDTVTVSATVEGYTITGTAHRTGYAFDFGDGPATSSTDGGSETDPVARHTYETKGTYHLRITTTWRAEYTMTGPGLPTPTPVDIGTAHLTTTQPYRVVEIRATLVR